jgi:hypothetical protein
MSRVILVVGWINRYRDGTFQSSYGETHNGSCIAAAVVQLYSGRLHYLNDIQMFLFAPICIQTRIVETWMNFVLL